MSSAFSRYSALATTVQSIIRHRTFCTPTLWECIAYPHTTTHFSCRSRMMLCTLIKHLLHAKLPPSRHSLTMYEGLLLAMRPTKRKKPGQRRTCSPSILPLMLLPLDVP